MVVYYLNIILFLVEKLIDGNNSQSFSKHILSLTLIIPSSPTERMGTSRY